MEKYLRSDACLHVCLHVCTNNIFVYASRMTDLLVLYGYGRTSSVPFTFDRATLAWISHVKGCPSSTERREY